MAVTTPEAYTTGALFSATGHNDNIYGPSGSIGVHRGLNGGLTSAEINASFQIRRDIIQPGGVIPIAFTPMQTRQVNYMSEFIGSDDGYDFVAISGACCRFKIPFDCTYAMYEVQAEVGQFLIGTATEQSSTDTVGILSVFLDGVRQGYTDTLLHNWATSSEMAANAANLGRSGRATIHHSFQLQAESVSAGWHEVSLRLGIQRTTLSYARTIDADTVPDYIVTYDCFGRITAYNRSAHIIGLL